MIRAEPNMPASRMKKQSHSTGLNWKMKPVGQQSAHHHAAAGHVGADFPACIDGCADDHANQGRYDDAAHIAWQVYAIHRQQAGHVAQYGHSVRDKALFAVSQFVECPAVDFLKQIDAQHR